VQLTIILVFFFVRGPRRVYWRGGNVATLVHMHVWRVVAFLCCCQAP